MLNYVFVVMGRHEYEFTFIWWLQITNLKLKDNSNILDFSIHKAYVSFEKQWIETPVKSKAKMDG